SSVKKCWNCSVMQLTLAMGCQSPFRRNRLLLVRQKANLHPLAFYTSEVTSPRTGTERKVQDGGTKRTTGIHVERFGACPRRGSNLDVAVRRDGGHAFDGHDHGRRVQQAAR